MVRRIASILFSMINPFLFMKKNNDRINARKMLMMVRRLKKVRGINREELFRGKCTPLYI
jgi:hypothetical protein